MYLWNGSVPIEGCDVYLWNGSVPIEGVCTYEMGVYLLEGCVPMEWVFWVCTYGDVYTYGRGVNLY